MSCAVKSSLFHLDPESWLGKRLDSGLQEVCSVKAALAFEITPNKGEIVITELQEALEKERRVIERLPEIGLALRGDRIEKKRASESQEDSRPSVDVYIGRDGDLLLVECKYKACPETQIVKSIDAFRMNVIRKFDASQMFLHEQGAKLISPDRIVLFNSESIDKVISMFRRIQLQDESHELHPYHLMDTAEFGKRCMV